jgi:hypothetical protein
MYLKPKSIEKCSREGKPAASHLRIDDSFVRSHTGFCTCSILQTMSLRTGPLILHLWRPPKGNNHRRVADNHSHLLPTPESHLSTLILLQTTRLEMNALIVHSKQKPRESRRIARLSVTHPQSPPAQPVQPAITAQSCRRAIQSTTVTVLYSQATTTGIAITTTPTL